MDVAGDVFVASFSAVLFPCGFFDGIWDLIGSVSGGCPTYSFMIFDLNVFIKRKAIHERVGRKILRN